MTSFWCFLLLTLKIFHTFSCVATVDLKQKHVSWVCSIKLNRFLNMSYRGIFEEHGNQDFCQTKGEILLKVLLKFQFSKFAVIYQLFSNLKKDELLLVLLNNLTRTYSHSIFNLRVTFLSFSTLVLPFFDLNMLFLTNETHLCFPFLKYGLPPQ